MPPRKTKKGTSDKRAESSQKNVSKAREKLREYIKKGKLSQVINLNDSDPEESESEVEVEQSESESEESEVDSKRQTRAKKSYTRAKKIDSLSKRRSKGVKKGRGFKSRKVDQSESEESESESESEVELEQSSMGTLSHKVKQRKKIDSLSKRRSNLDYEEMLKNYGKLEKKLNNFLTAKKSKPIPQKKQMDKMAILLNHIKNS